MAQSGTGAEKAAFLAIVGCPNVGKSSLLNAMLGQKLAIVSSKPQTTRTRIMGILTEGETQLVFLDTPRRLVSLAFLCSGCAGVRFKRGWCAGTGAGTKSAGAGRHAFLW